jgi:hypothetical protein
MSSEPRESPGKGDSTPVFNLEFVNMNAGSETERQRNQQIIRSTAMKNFHRKQQLQRRQEKGGSLKDVAVKNKKAHSKSKKISHLNAEDDPSETSSGSQSEETVLDLSSLVSTLSSSNSSDRSFGPGESSRHGNSNSLNSWALSAASSPTSLLGAGRIDPFRIQPVDIGSHMPELIDHCEFCPRPRKNYSRICDFIGAFLIIVCRQLSVLYGQGSVRVVLMERGVNSLQHGLKRSTKDHLSCMLCSLEQLSTWTSCEGPG